MLGIAFATITTLLGMSTGFTFLQCIPDILLGLAITAIEVLAIIFIKKMIKRKKEEQEKDPYKEWIKTGKVNH